MCRVFLIDFGSTFTKVTAADRIRKDCRDGVRFHDDRFRYRTGLDIALERLRR